MSEDSGNRRPLAPVFEAAIKSFDQWSEAHLKVVESRTQVTGPLYHYTNAAGLEDIFKNQEIWFTNYMHLNDPTEIYYGIEITSEILKEIDKLNDCRIGVFCKIVDSLFTHQNMNVLFRFFIASFSCQRDDLGLWRAYGDNGRGFALGLSPHLFGIEEKSERKPHENVFVAPVVYGRQDARQQLMPAIEQAVRIVGATIEQAPELMTDRDVGKPFLETMAERLVASQLIFNSLFIKHEAYQDEEEVRLIILGEHDKLAPHISTRTRNGQIVPFIKSAMPIQTECSIKEIVVGPAAAASAKDGVGALLKPFNAPCSIVRRSTIPYRPN